MEIMITVPKKEFIEAMRLFKELFEDAECEISARYNGSLHFPSEARRMARDMIPVTRAKDAYNSLMLASGLADSSWIGSMPDIEEYEE